MAKASKCDRCGKYYDVKDRKGSNAIRIIKANSEGEQIGVTKHYDMCKECMDSLMSFMTLDSWEDI